ncbi:asparaginase [Flavobacterium caseinilyticum]|uniref:asparaginase n=1 Tax=Flavobacterium caseinilyticum TaxID=2541732 RepID=A0A4V2YU59_9FLAO|nr:asparaginase [Flavobacterium caseinilyticum]TDD76447.1 asparaginase [Flavobacterium caseinilyticum]
MLSKSKILLIYTGGTIGMKKDFETGALRAFNFSKLLQRIPELKQLDCDIETISFEKPIDSSNMNPEKWAKIATIIEDNYAIFDGFVVLHGSDTMSYSASALSFMLENLAKPVIFTGSQLPIGDLRTDAKENLITAIQIASLREKGKPVISEVCLYFEYKLYRGNRTTKINAEHFNAFTSPNYPDLVESGVHLKLNSELFWALSSNLQFKVHKNLDNNVAIIKMFPGINEVVLAAILSIPNLKGIILETYGAGNAPTEDWFINLLKEAINKGLHIINVTQCSAGSVNMGQYETSTALKEIGVISGKDITTEAAITKLMHLLGQETSGSEFKNAFETSLRGEMA